MHATCNISRMRARFLLQLVSLKRERIERKLCFIEFRCQTSQGAGPGRQSWAPKKSAFLHRVPVTRHFDRRARRCKAGRKNDTGADAPKRAKKTCSGSLCFSATRARVIRDLLAATRHPVICFYPYSVLYVKLHARSSARGAL